MEADLDLLLEHVDFVLLLEQLLLLFGNLRHKRHAFTCLCLPSLTLIRASLTEQTLLITHSSLHADKLMLVHGF